MVKLIQTHKILLFLCIVAASFLWNCNVNDGSGKTYLNLELPDTITVAKGYDSVIVNIKSDSGKIVYPNIFNGPFHNSESNKAILSHVYLPDPVPEKMVVVIDVYKNKVKVITYEMNVNGLVAQKMQRTFSDTVKTPVIPGPNPNPIKPDTTKTDTIKIDTAKIIPKKTISINLLSANPLNLSVSDADGIISAKVLPDSVSQIIEWSISDTSIAKITSENKIKPIKVGQVTVTGKARADTTITLKFGVNIFLPIKVDGITLSPKSLNLFTGGDFGILTVKTVGNDTGAHYNLTSSEPSIASVRGDGKVKGLKAGSALITAAVLGYPTITSVCSISVVTEKPIIKIIDPANDITINSLSYILKFNVKIPSLGIDSTKDSALTLIDGPNVITISRSNFGVTGNGKVTLTVNRNAPGVPVFTAQNAYTNNPTLIWNWAAVSGASKYQVRTVDGDFTKPTGTAEQSALSVTIPASTDGNYTLYVRSMDALGNFSSAASQSITLDTKAPDAVTFTGVDNLATASLTPTWSWTPSASNPGIGVYEVSLDGGAHSTVTSTFFTPSSPLTDNATHTLVVWQKDQVPGVLGASQGFRFRALNNLAAAPTVSGPAGVKNGDVTNKTDFSWIGGARGNDTYRVTVNTETFYVDQPTTTYSLPANSPDGTCTLHVQELDELGRPGADGTFKIVLDRTKPLITFLTRDNFITNKSPAIISYKVDNGATQTSNCDLGTVIASKTCSVTATDLAGNSTTSGITIYYRPDTYFMKPDGTGDGSSWENASGNLKGMVEDSTKMNKEYWLATGVYLPALKPIIVANNSITIYGGFDLSKYPVDLNGRTNSTLDSLVKAKGRDSTTSKLKIDGLILNNEFWIANLDAYLNSVRFIGQQDVNGGAIYEAIYVEKNATLTGFDVISENSVYNFNLMTITGKARFSSSKFTGNRVLSTFVGSCIFVIGNLIFDLNSNISGNFFSLGIDIQLQNGGQVSIDNTVTIDCSKINKSNGGSVFCKDHFLP